MLSGMILFYLLSHAGAKLMRVYPAPMRQLLTHIISPNYMDKLKLYFSSGDVKKEPQNDVQVLSQD